MMKEIMRTNDAGKISFIESILSAEEIKYVIAGFDAGGGLQASIPARVLVHEDQFDRAIELLISAGYKHEIYPMKKPDVANDP